MLKSNRSRRKNKSKPSKPYPDFPLFAHATKRWAKKIRGKLHYFGPWADPDAALKKYLLQKDALHAGLTPRPAGVSDTRTLAYLCNHFRTYKKRMLATGEIAQCTFDDYVATCERIIAFFGRDRLLIDITVDDLGRYRDHLAQTRKLVALSNEITRCRVLFKHAFDNDLIERPIKYGTAFKKPTAKALGKEREEQGPRMFQAEEIRDMLFGRLVVGENGPRLVKAGRSLRAMILLGVNCGFGNHDCAALRISAIDFEAGCHTFSRPKTQAKRKAFLWPETITAIREVLAHRPEPKRPELADRLFLTHRGESWAKDTSDNPVSKEMAKLIAKMGINGHRNFYGLRHTTETIGGESTDQVSVDYCMGHKRGDMAESYRDKAPSDERLRKVTDTIHAWLFDGKAVANV
jgi:integrase